MSLTIYDSIIVKGSKILIRDFNPMTGLYLANNRNSKDIVLFDKTGKIKILFNRYGKGPKEYSLIRDVDFWDDNSLVILTGNVLQHYEITGKYIQTIELDNENPITTRIRLSVFTDMENNKNIFYYADSIPDINNYSNEYYFNTMRLFYLVNPGKKFTRRFIKIDEKSKYSKDIIYTHYLPNYSINNEKRCIDINFPNEQKIFRYDLDDSLKLIKSFPISADFFREDKGTPVGRKPKNSITDMIQTPNFVKVFSFGDTLLTLYFGGLDEKKETYSIEQANIKMSEVPKYIQVFINEKKVVPDIKLPNRIMSIRYIHNLNEIVFAKAPNNYDELHNTNTFLIGKIEYEK